ncbi:Tn3 family transposase [Undibacterium sp. FT79W]|nr:Tn3 family transposase [Undibacterium sp. FT79W]
MPLSLYLSAALKMGGLPYNTLILSRVYEQKLRSGDDTAIEMMRRISPVAWQHINLFGTFEFTRGSAGIP